MKAPASRRRAFSLPELLIVALLFSMFLVVCYNLLNQGVAIWHRSEGSSNVTLQLAKARRAFDEDLRPSAISECRVGPSSLWFLSGVNPSTGEVLRRSDGSPYWRRNILYYLARPRKHDAMFGVSCSTEPGHCPHLMLVRRVIDTNPPTTGDDASLITSMEKLMTPEQAAPWMVAPEGYELAFATPSENDRLVAIGLLEFLPTLSSSRPEVELSLAGFQPPEAGKKVALGAEDLTGSPFTRKLIFSVFPGNSGI